MPCFTIEKDQIHCLPILHYNMETAAHVYAAFHTIKPDCVAVELPETMTDTMLHAASRLPDLSLVHTETQQQKQLYYMVEPCDGAFEGLRCALEERCPAYCIDLDVDAYPDIHESYPDPFAIHEIGLEAYYTLCTTKTQRVRTQQDEQRELHMAKRLKELSLRYGTVLFISGMYHIPFILELLNRKKYPIQTPVKRDKIELSTLSEKCCREVMGEYAWLTQKYEEQRTEACYRSLEETFLPNRQQILYQLYKTAGKNYEESFGKPFVSYHLRNTMKFARNYALIKGRLQPDLYQSLSSAKGCVDHNYAYEVWALATSYSHLKNIDNLPEKEVSVEDVWTHSKNIQFHLKEKCRKKSLHDIHEKRQQDYRFQPPSPFTLCSYEPEDLIIENFGSFLQKKGKQILSEENARTVPYSGSLEDGLDLKETIRHFHEKKLYVKIKGKPPGAVGSVVIIFDEDHSEDRHSYKEKFPWKMTWMGEHEQESDMALYATFPQNKVIGPGISQCEYGGLMMSYPPQRMLDVWNDPDYSSCRCKSEVLLLAAIDYSTSPIIVYVAATPPRSRFKSVARRFDRKIVYIPIGQVSLSLINKVRTFHVLDGHGKRDIADEYIF